MPGLFNRLKTWITKEVVKSADLNGEFDNIINNLIASKLGGFSTSVPQMQTQLDPGALGTEVLADSVAEELEELRFVIARIAGQAFWYQQPALTLGDVNTLLQLGVGIPRNRIISGLTRTTSDQSAYLIADGATNEVTLKAGGSNPNFVVSIKGTQLTISSDIVFSGLSFAPSSNNTAVINSAAISSDKYAGETDSPFSPIIPMTSVGTAISAKANQFVAFKITNGGGTEYFIGQVNTTGLFLTNCYRGYFFDSNYDPIENIPISNGDTLELMQLSWVFLTTSSLLDVTYNQPIFSATTPSASPGDYWFDLNTQIWKKFNGSSFVDANAILIGTCFQDTSATIASRSFDFFAVQKATNTISLDNAVVPASTMSSSFQGSEISVNGINISYGFTKPFWDTATDMEAGDAFTVNNIYYFYVTEEGKFVISLHRPYERFDLYGYYHPYNTWRCVGESVSQTGPSFQSVINYGSIFKKQTSYQQLAPRTQTGPSDLIYGAVQVTASTGAYSTASPTFVSVTSVAVQSKGGIVHVILESDGSGVASSISGNGEFRILRGSTEIYRSSPNIAIDAGPPGMIQVTDHGVTSGVQAYTLQVKAFSGNVTVTNCILLAYEH